MVAALSVTPAFADLLLYEPFDYTPGSAVIGQTDVITSPTSTWDQVGTAGTNGVHQVVSGSLTPPTGFGASFGNSGGMMGADYNEYAQMNFPGTYKINTTLYYSLLLEVNDLTGLTVANTNLNANNDGIIAFNSGAGSGQGLIPGRVNW